MYDEYDWELVIPGLVFVVDVIGHQVCFSPCISDSAQIRRMRISAMKRVGLT